MSAEQFNPFNQAIQNCLDQEYPDSLLAAVSTVAERFGLETGAAASLLSIKFKKQLEEEYHMNDESEDDGFI